MPGETISIDWAAQGVPVKFVEFRYGEISAYWGNLYGDDLAFSGTATAIAPDGKPYLGSTWFTPPGPGGYQLESILLYTSESRRMVYNHDGGVWKYAGGNPVLVKTDPAAGANFSAQNFTLGPLQATPLPVTFTDNYGTAADSYTVPTTAGIEYIVDGKVQPAGTHPATGTVDVRAQAKANTKYALASGATARWVAHLKDSLIAEKYAAPGVANILGEPTSAELVGLRNGGVSRTYERGSIIWSADTGAHLSMGGIRTTWLLNKSENGQLGYPTTEEVSGLRNGGVIQYYQGGAIVWSPASGSQVSMGGIRTTWMLNNAENGQLGYPISREITGLRNGGVLQYYQGGAIVWSPASGSQVSMGGIRTTWLLNKAENGQLGYPTSREITGLRNGGVIQYYQGGAIVWSPASGSQVSMGAIRTAWAGTGYENGRLGYPTSREYSLGGGAVAQDYQGGRISWAPGKGASVN
jgi:uncharacterized protein with LGFP repeats